MSSRADLDVGPNSVLYCRQKCLEILVWLGRNKSQGTVPLASMGAAAEAGPAPCCREKHVFCVFYGKIPFSSRDITVHHRIREPTNPHAPKIHEFDARFRKGEQVVEEELKR